MFNKNRTIEALLGALERIYEVITDAYSRHDIELLQKISPDARRIEIALDRLQLGRIRYKRLSHKATGRI